MPSNSCNTIKIIPPNLLYLTWPNTRGGGFCKVLGIDITSITNRNTANKSLGFLRRNLQTKNPELRELTRPLSSPSWCRLLQSGTPPLLTTYRKSIKMVQRWAARWVLGDYSPYSSISDMLGRHGWRTLEQRHADRTSPFLQNITWICHSYRSLHTSSSWPHISWTSHLLAHRQSYTWTTTTSTHFFPWHLFSEQSPGPHCQPDRPW